MAGGLPGWWVTMKVWLASAVSMLMALPVGAWRMGNVGVRLVASRYRLRAAG